VESQSKKGSIVSNGGMQRVLDLNAMPPPARDLSINVFDEIMNMWDQ